VNERVIKIASQLQHKDNSSSFYSVDVSRNGISIANSSRCACVWLKNVIQGTLNNCQQIQWRCLLASLHPPRYDLWLNTIARSSAIA